VGKADNLATLMSLRPSGVKDIPSITPTKYLIYSKKTNKQTKHTKINKLSKLYTILSSHKKSNNFKSKNKFNKN